VKDAFQVLVFIENTTPQDTKEPIILTTRTAAVLVGKDDLGPWETPEMQACLSQFVRRHLPVIPVLLPDVSTEPELPLFLQNLTWVDLRGGLTEDGLKKLEWGITGVKPEPSSGSAENKLPSKKPDHRKLVFVNIGLEDKSLGENISKALSKNVPCFLPLLEAKPSDFRQDWEQLLTSCDGLITVYGEVKNMWVRGQLLEYRKIKREQPLETQAIYEGPPEEKEPLSVTLPPDVMIMDCRKGLNENELHRFLNALGLQS